ncbi:MAG: protease inhibitor I42 family protein [Oscillospiraceae bacterium]|nr:protease inhibitor I42 family protein [Oscillospiraceae bacterium]
MKKLIVMVLAAMFILSACSKEELPVQSVTLTLDSNPTTGFSWQVEQSEELFQVDKVYTADERPEGTAGSGGKETITLTPVKPGKTVVTLSYARPLEGGETADQVIYTFTVDRNLQVEMTDAYSLGTEEPVTTPAPEIQTEEVTD